MSNNRNRAKLSPRYQQALAMFSKGVGASETDDPDSLELPETEAETKAETTAENAEQERVQTEETTTGEADDDWVDSLTYDEPSVEPENPAPPAEQQEQEAPDTTQNKGESDEDYIARMRSEFRNMEHVDAEVADELFDRAIKPAINHFRGQTEAELARIRGEVALVRTQTESIVSERQQKAYTETNKKIIERHPKAAQIMKSKEFADFVNKDSNPYATESNLVILSRAYQSGDSDYVIKALDSFVESRGKPKPPVNADGNGATAASTPKKSKRMSEAEFLKQRRAIMANPRKYPQGALRKLEIDFFSQQ